MDGNAVIWCEGAFGTTDGKTAHGLVRRTRRYRVMAVVDSTLVGSDAGEVLDGERRDIPVTANLKEALAAARSRGTPATHFVVGIATLGGHVGPALRAAVKEAIEGGLNVDSGLHDFLSDDAELAQMARDRLLRIRDVRKSPPTAKLHAFTGAVAKAPALRVAVLGSDSAIGKRTTTWLLYEALGALGARCAFIGTGQTAWLQGADYSICLDSLVNDFVAGELEHAVLQAQEEMKPDVILIEGQGSLLNPAFPGGFEILAAARPHCIVFQHAPMRRWYDLGIEEKVEMHPLERQILAAELISGKPVVALSLNHEGISGRDQIDEACKEIERATGRICRDPLVHGAGDLAKRIADLYLA